MVAIVAWLLWIQPMPQVEPYVWYCKPAQKPIDFNMEANAIVLLNGYDVLVKMPSGHFCLSL